MPSGVERALADALSLEHADVPWQPPAVLPSTPDLHAAIAALTVAPATPKHAAWCLAKLMLAFEPTAKLSADDTRLRAATWLEACGDLGDELWSEATLRAIQGSKWMPKPAEFRVLVDAKLRDRATKLQRCRAMLAAQTTADPDKPDPLAPWKSPETYAERLRASISSYRRFGRDADADRVQVKLDRLNSSEFVRIRPNQAEPVLADRPPFVPADTPTARRMAELAAAHREGRPAPVCAEEAEAT